MTDEEHEEPASQTPEIVPSGSTEPPRVAFTLQGAVASSDHSHFHHHVFRHRTESQDKPVRFKDSRANEQAEKLREKLRERQLSGAAQNDAPETILVPCHGTCKFKQGSGEAGASEDTEVFDDDADEILQQLLSNITSLSVGSISGDSAVVSWDELDIEGCVYSLNLTTGRNTSVTEEVETPHILSDLVPGTQYSVCVNAVCGSITGAASSPQEFTTLSTSPSKPQPPRPGGATKSSLNVKWNTAANNGCAITHYILYWDEGGGGWRELVRCYERQYKITGLKPGTEYNFSVSAVNEMGESERSETGTCRTGFGVPNPPTCIYLGQASETSLTICWSPPNDNGGAEVTGYNVEQETEYGFISVYDGELQECHIPNLTRSTRYKFRVYSGNVAGESKPSAVVMFTTRAGLPNPPVRVRVEGKERSDSAIIAWEPPVLEGEQQILRYNLKLNTVTGSDSTANRANGDVLEFHTTDDTKILINSLLPGTLYRILVTVVTAGGEGPPSNPFNFKTRPVSPSAPAPPSLRTKPSPYSLNLLWGPPSYTGGSVITRYTLEIFRDDWLQLYTGTETSFLVTELTPGKSYRFRLRCHNCAGASLYSNTVNFVTAPAPPLAPQPPVITSKGPYAAIIAWPETSTNGAPITSYSVDMCLLGDTFAEVYNDKETECVVRNLNPGSTYYCIVKANSVVGQSVPSEVAVYHSPPAPPEPPTKIHLVESSDSSLKISWDPPSSPGADILHYNVCFNNGPASKCVENEFYIEGLNSETQYKVRVQAVNSVGSGQFSSAKVVVTGTPLPPALTGPILLSSRGHNFLKVGWTSVRSVKSYLLERASAESDDFISVYEGNKPQVKISKLSANTDYRIRVCGVNNAGTGPWLLASFSTDSIPPPPITKVYKSIKENQLTISWQVKDKLQEEELFQILHSTDGDTFTPIYEGLDRNFTTSLLPETTYSFKVRVKRDSTDPPEYGPFSQTLLVKLKPPPLERKESERETKLVEREIESSGTFEDSHVVVFILLAMCLPAVLTVVYFIYF
ncbi:fibronectin type-III domain-containing protein 3A-like [Bolinopsis microptera]|uniref:fibronectin type-III domain-containing protein 3A-like n=1 Tax=Bolinopsis microptera TaxID=2820187 RepID=UPI00307AE4CD